MEDDVIVSQVTAMDYDVSHSGMGAKHLTGVVFCLLSTLT